MPAFGKYVAVKILLDKKKLGTFTPRGELGRLLVVRPMTDRTCKILVGTRIVKKTTSKPVSDKLAEVTQGRNVYLKPSKICVNFGLVGKDTLWRLKRALYGLKESSKLWKKKKDKVLFNIKLQHPKLGQLKLVQSQVHFCLWLIIKDDNFTGKKGLKVKFQHAATTVEDQNVEQEFELTNLQFGILQALMAVYVDDLLVAASFDIVTSIQTSVENQWKTGLFQIEYESGCKDINVILLHQERYTYELMDKLLAIFTMLDKGLFQVFPKDLRTWLSHFLVCNETKWKSANS
eukprot:6252389-Amphidinium_carterae.1